MAAIHSRRAVLAASAVALTPLAAAARAALPGCAGAPTPSQTAGPYFTPGSPLKPDLRGDGDGVPVLLEGFALDARCRPIRAARIELWHADAGGRYDNEAYAFRGHVFTGDDGRYRFDTIKPGRYPGRTLHYHVRLRPPGGGELTTQLYFPGEPANARDFGYRESLELRLEPLGEGIAARFDFEV